MDGIEHPNYDNSFELIDMLQIPDENIGRI